MKSIPIILAVLLLFGCSKKITTPSPETCYKCKELYPPVVINVDSSYLKTGSVNIPESYSDQIPIPEILDTVYVTIYESKEFEVKAKKDVDDRVKTQIMRKKFNVDAPVLDTLKLQKTLKKYKLRTDSVSYRYSVAQEHLRDVQARLEECRSGNDHSVWVYIIPVIAVILGFFLGRIL